MTDHPLIELDATPVDAEHPYEAAEFVLDEHERSRIRRDDTAATAPSISRDR